MKRPIVTLTSDFGLQSQGIGNMEGVIVDIAPNARVIHLMHGLPDFDIRAGARALEAIKYMPIGFHVCVVDPGVGTARKPIIIKVKRGDYLVGPDNGVLIPAVRILGGFEKAVEITNSKYMLQPVSPIFHGRHIFAPTAAYLAKGVSIGQFGASLQFDQLIAAPYEDAVIRNGEIKAEVININKFGSLNLNILHRTWDEFKIALKQEIIINFGNRKLTMPFVETFGQVPKNQPLILKDDYGRIEVAVNLGNFAKKHQIKIGDYCTIRKA